MPQGQESSPTSSKLFIFVGAPRLKSLITLKPECKPTPLYMYMYIYWACAVGVHDVTVTMETGGISPSLWQHRRKPAN